MKFLSAKLYLAVAALGLFLGACNSAEKMQQEAQSVKLEAEPPVLAVRGDSVSFTIEGNIPEKYFAKKAVVIMEPQVQYNGKTLTFDEYIMAGEKAYTGNLEVDKIVGKEGASISISETYAFEQDMRGEDLILKSVFRFVSPKADELGIREQVDAEATTEKQLAVGTIITALREKPTDELKYVTNKQPIPESRSARIYYKINRSNIRRSQLSREEVEMLQGFADREGFVLKGVKIKSAASPDGEYRLNKNLAAERSAEALNFVNRDLRDMGVESIQDSAFFTRANIDEDFDGLRELIRASSLPDKREVLDILNSNAPNEQKEKRLRKTESAEYILEEIMPKLRYSTITYTGYSRQRPLSVLDTALENQGMEALTYTEMNRLALSEKSNSEDERELYEAMRSRFPDRVGGHNNLGVWYIENGDYSQAVKVLSPAVDKFPNEAIVHNNLGAAYRNLDEYKKAMDHFQKAARGGINTSNNMGILYINTGDYASSVNEFSDVKCGNYNAALANILNENYEQAKKEFDCMTEKDGMDLYLMAVLGARSDDQEMMTTGLRRAVSMDSKFRDMARKDKEFLDYKDKKAFQAALN